MLTRRDLIRWLGAAAALAKLPACSSASAGDRVFTSEQLAMLNGFADVLIPPDDQPGGSHLGVVPYIEGLLNAFFVSGPPLIYAGGPCSDRNPNPDGSFPANDFENFLPLDRVLDLSWRVQIFGSASVASGAPNDALLGPVIALKDQLTAGLDLAQAMANGHGMPDYQAIYDAMDPDFQDLLFDLVTQAAWAAPEYGGNPDLNGWKMVHFEGDSLPLGYSQWNGAGYDERSDSPLSTANPSDPEPMTSDIESLLATVTNVLGGKAAS
jgi:hypothetical protein